MNVVKRVNGLNGEQISRADLHKIYKKAKEQEQTQIAEKIEAILSQYDDAYFDVNIDSPFIEETPHYILDNLPFEETPEEEYTGLNKAVSPDEIYQYITDLVINTIKAVGHLPWQREWEKTSLFNGWQAINYDSKKGYRGINYVLTNFEVKMTEEGPALFPRDLSNPYFLTFNQIEKHGGKLKKGSKGVRVVYFTKLYSHTERDPKTGNTILDFGTYNQKKFIAWLQKNRSKIKQISDDKDFDRLANSYIPILKYYNVFAGADVEGIDWGLMPKNENVDKPERERIEIAEAIVKAMPNPPKFIFGGDQPVYSPGSDHIRMTPIEAFKNEQSYYSTLFHEMIHSTGHRSRLDRFNLFDGKKEYAFEELIAELGAVFLCAESGILFQTIENSAKYLRGWNSRLVKSLEEDNRFFFRAASKAQSGSDYILDRDKDGQPAYLKSLVIEPVKVEKPKPKKKFLKESKVQKRNKKAKPGEQLALLGETPVVGLNGEIIISTDQFKHFKAKDLRNFLLVYYNTFLKGKKLAIGNSLKSVKLVSSSGRKIAHGGPIYAAKAAVINHFEEVVENSTYNNWGDRKKSDSKDLLGYLNFKSKVLIDNEKRHVRITIAVYKDRQTLLKSYDVGKNKKPSLPKESPKLSTSTKKVSSSKADSKDSKKTNIDKKGLKNPSLTPVDPEPKQPQPAPVANRGRNTVASNLNRRQSQNTEFYKMPDPEILKFLDRVEIKPRESVVITIAGEKGSSKTHGIFKWINAFAQNYNVGHASLEEDPASYLYEQKAKQYFNQRTMASVEAPYITNIDQLDELIQNNDIIFIDSFAKLQEMVRGFGIDKDLRKKYDGKLFVVIFQQTSDGKMRGGSKSEYDGDIILYTEKHSDFKENYMWTDKNRYTQKPIDGLRYYIYTGKTVYADELENNQEENNEPQPVQETRPQGTLIIH